MSGAVSAVFEVWRQDDNGNRYLVSTHTDRDAAEDAGAGMEAGVQHKQLYYVVERAAAPTSPDQAT